MIEVLSLVHFSHPRRVSYLDRSWSSFYNLTGGALSPFRHVVLDSSVDLSAQTQAYKRLGVEVVHCPGQTYGERLHRAVDLLRGKYVLFYPDDFEWIFDFPVTDACAQAEKHNVRIVKLTGRGQSWYGQVNPKPEFWFDGRKLITGERLTAADDLFVSDSLWFRDFHEQFSLACNLIETEFLRWVVKGIPLGVKNPGQAEKWSYLRLLFTRYKVAYYRTWIPAFHFIDLSVEGDTPLNRRKARENLLPENRALYNRLYNGCSR